MGCWFWIGTTPLAASIVFDLAQRDGQHGQQVGLVGQLAHPDPAEALVAQPRQVTDGGVDRGFPAEARELGEHAHLHAPM